jgi:hypothetical protein
MKIESDYQKISIYSDGVGYSLLGERRDMSGNPKRDQVHSAPHCVRRCAVGQTTIVLIVHSFGGRGSPRG